MSAKIKILGYASPTGGFYSAETCLNWKANGFIPLISLTDHEAAMKALRDERDNAIGMLERDVVLKAVLFHFGPEGAAKVTASALEARDAALSRPTTSENGGTGG